MMTQNEHTLIAMVITAIIAFVFRNYLIFPEDWKHADKKVNEWFDKLSNN